jgi:CHAT domain-containing protein
LIIAVVIKQITHQVLHLQKQIQQKMIQPIKQYLKQAIMLQLILVVHLNKTKQHFNMAVLTTRPPVKLNALIIHKMVQIVLITVLVNHTIA